MSYVVCLSIKYLDILECEITITTYVLSFGRSQAVSTKILFQIHVSVSIYAAQIASPNKFMFRIGDSRKRLKWCKFRAKNLRLVSPWLTDSNDRTHSISTMISKNRIIEQGLHRHLGESAIQQSMVYLCCWIMLPLCPIYPHSFIKILANVSKIRLTYMSFVYHLKMTRTFVIGGFGYYFNI